MKTKMMELENKILHMKNYNIGKIKMTMETNGFPKGLILNRELTIRECRYILKTLLGINISIKEDFYDIEEYNDYNNDMKINVNEWLVGNRDDSCIMEYAFDCSDEPIGIMNLIPILFYLKKKNIIN